MLCSTSTSISRTGHQHVLQCSCESMARSCTYTPTWRFHQPSTHRGTHCLFPLHTGCSLPPAHCTRECSLRPSLCTRGCPLPPSLAQPPARCPRIPPPPSALTHQLPPRTLPLPRPHAQPQSSLPPPSAHPPSLAHACTPRFAPPAHSPPGPAAGRGGPACALPRSVPPRSAPPRPEARRQAGRNAFNSSQPVHQRQQVLALPAALGARLGHLQVPQDALQLRSPRRLLRRDTGSAPRAATGDGEALFVAEEEWLESK